MNPLHHLSGIRVIVFGMVALGILRAVFLGVHWLWEQVVG